VLQQHATSQFFLNVHLKIYGSFEREDFKVYLDETLEQASQDYHIEEILYCQLSSQLQ